MASTSEKVADCLESGRSFVVEAGAGSGKTSTLVESLTYLLATRAQDLLSSGQRIVCITYTNVAANEIMSRINRDPLVRVSTIHDFLWSVISRFQSELRAGIRALNEDSDAKKKITNLELSGVPVEYWQYPRRWQDGKVSHDDVVILSEWMFKNYSKLVRLTAGNYPIIFVDEYQDTHEKIIGLLLDLLAAHDEPVTIGLFGDHMQKIYSSGIGRIERPELTVIQKQENYRCSISVIDVLNKLRPALQQIPGANNPKGSARFFWAEKDLNDPVAVMRAKLRLEGWTEASEKVLKLTRRGIADDLGWEDLLGAYSKRGNLKVDDFIRGEDEFGQIFSDIENMASSFAQGKYGTFLALRAKSGDFLNTHSDKEQIAAKMSELNRLRDNETVGAVLEYTWKTQLLRKSKRILRLEEKMRLTDDSERAAKEREFFDELMVVPFLQVTNFERYRNYETPFSTNHGVKGEEYKNVLVVIDDKLWSQYRFEAVLAGDISKSQYERSLNLFYVSCSRAKRNLVVLATSPMGYAAIEGAKDIFGRNCVTRLMVETDSAQ